MFFNTSSSPTSCQTRSVGRDVRRCLAVCEATRSTWFEPDPGGAGSASTRTFSASNLVPLKAISKRDQYGARLETTSRGSRRVVLLTDEQYGVRVARLWRYGSGQCPPNDVPLFTYNLTGYKAAHAAGKEPVLIRRVVGCLLLPFPSSRLCKLHSFRLIKLPITF